MNPALLTLIRLQFIGFFRRMTRGARSPRRAIFLIVGMGIVVLWLGSAVIGTMAARHAHHGRRPPTPEHFRDVAPLGLLAICFLTIVSSSGDKAIAFTPGEVDLLFPGPFSRRELLAFKLLKSTLVALITAFLLSLALLTYAHSWPACYVGVFLTLLFVQLFSTAGVLLGQTLSRRLYTAVQRIILVAGIGTAVLLARNVIASSGGMHAVYALRDSDLGRNLLAPFDPFGRAITAAGSLDLLQSASEAVLIDLGLLAIVVLLDANYLEAATAASRRRYAQIQRIRGGSILSAGVKGNVSWKLPRLPWLGGAGPIIWRQATSAARSARGLLMVLLLLSLVVGSLFGAAFQDPRAARILVGAIAWMTVLLAGMLKFDFRGDIDHMEALKGLPIRPAPLAVGQILVPTLILTCIHMLLLGSVMVATPVRRDLLAVAAALALPFNALLMSTENAIFLLFPTRPAAVTPGDFQMLGRQVAQLLMKAISVMVGLVLAFAIAAIPFMLLGGPLVVLTIVAGAVLLAETTALVPLMAWAFRRFDPSVDTPA